MGTLILHDGQKFNGVAFNLHEVQGEVVFNTGMTGYEETLTDPSYAGQILVFTYPLLGNYGVSRRENWESGRIHVKGVICANLMQDTSHHQSRMSFPDWLKQQHIPLLTGVDTRELTKVLRDNGTLNGRLLSSGVSAGTKPEPVMAENWMPRVSTPEVRLYGQGRYKLIVVDFGVKQNIIRSLLQFNVTIKHVPYDYDYSQEDYDGLMLSNGPGDPKLCTLSIQILQKALLKDKPIFGVCLGSQLLGLAAGADTYKLKFGHRGHNQPCIDLASQRCYLTSQNHGYAVCNNSLPDDWQVTFQHLHDGSIAGIKHKTKPFAAVQFHPESAPGPEDTAYFFKQFIDLVKQGEC